MEFLDLTTLITIAIAVFILLRLRSVLGTRTGYEKPNDMFEKAAKRKANENEPAAADNVVKLPTRGKAGEQDQRNPVMDEIETIAKPRTKLNKGLKDIVALDPNFSPKEFLAGADMAYEMIVNAFADGDERSLRNLLSHEVFEGFSAAIQGRKERNETVKSSFVGIDKSEIKSAEVKDTEAHVAIRFESQIVSATFDADGKLIDGDDHDVARVIDIWTFARDTRSNDPNWKLVATEAEG